MLNTKPCRAAVSAQANGTAVSPQAHARFTLLQFSVVGFRSHGLPVQQLVRAAPAVRKHQPADCLRYRGILISLVGVRHAGVDGRLIIER